MKFVLFVAKRLVGQKENSYAKNVIRIAIISIALSVAIMLISMSILQGFKDSIKQKIIGFGSHIQVVPFIASGQYSSTPITYDNNLVQDLQQTKGIQHLSAVLNKEGAIIIDNDFQAVILKGITPSYDTSFFANSLTQGKMPQMNKTSQQEIIISKTIADKLKLKLNQKIKIYFYIDGSYRSKNFTISGIYDTGLADYDQRFIVCDAQVLQNIFSLTDNTFSCYEITLNDFSRLKPLCENIYQKLPPNLTLVPITDLEPNLFSWLNLLDSNVIMIICIMIIITIVTLCSIILIMIFEKKTFIGIMKSFGSSSSQIAQIFIYKAAFITLKGILYGNIIAIILEVVQKYFNLIKLDPQSYYLTSVPIDINFIHILLIDLGAFLICLLSMLIPTHIITKISIVKNLKFE